MALKITKAFEPIQVRNITICIYAQPGVGRTSLGFSADDPLLLDADKAAYRAKNRRDAVLIESWDDVEAMRPEDLAGYKTVVVDTVGRVLDMMTVKLLRSSPKNGNGAGGLSLQGYGALKNAFTAWCNNLRSMGLDVVLLAHCDETKKGDDMIERLDIQGGSKNEVYKVCDAMGRIVMENRKRMLHFSPSDTSFGKNPGQFEPLEIPDFDKDPVAARSFLGGIIAKTKEAINRMSAEQTEVSGLMTAWQALVAVAKSADDFNVLIPKAKELDERIRDNAKRVLVKVAKDLGIAFDTKAGAFVAPAAALDPKAQGGSQASSTSPSPSETPSSAPANDNAPKADAGNAASSAHSSAAGAATASPQASTAGDPAKKGRAKKTEPQGELLAAAGGDRVPGQEG